MSTISPRELPGEETPAGRKGIEHILDLSNDVFGFSLTLLAIGIGVPALPAALASHELGPAILSLWPKVAIFFVSFFSVSIYWLAHERIFRFIRRYDNRLMWLNQLFLLVIAFMPVPSAVLGLYPLQPAAIVFFSATLATAGLVLVAIGTYATSGHRLVSSKLNRHVIRYLYLRGIVTTLLYVLAIIFAFVDPILVIGVWVLLAALVTFLLPVFRYLLAWIERTILREHPPQQPPRGA